MSYFDYKGNNLYCEKVRIKDIAQKVGTPAFIYSHHAFTDHINQLQTAFKKVNPIICYSMKANSNLAVLKSVVKQGAGLDIVSVGELYRAKKVKCDPKKIVFAGVGKSDREIEEAIKFGILLFNVESEPELELINRVASRLKRKAKVSLRVNPAVDPKTHAKIATGKSESKFGIDLQTARNIFSKRKKYKGISLCALHVHIGSQIVKGDPFVKAFKKVVSFVEELERQGVQIEYLNLGGGLGVVYHDEKPLSAKQFANQILPIFKGKKFKLIFEPGRFVAANAGVLIGEVLYVKKTDVKQFAITDAAMNDLIRPSLYEAYHGVLPVRKSKLKKQTYDVVGPICESGDYFAKNRKIQKLDSGDLIAVMSAGAYGFVMASNYNSRPRACEVLVRGKKFAVVRKRETFKSLMAGESIPSLVSSKN